METSNGINLPPQDEKKSVKTFFQVMEHKFTEVKVSPDGKIPTVQFLSCCRSILPLFDVLGSLTFKPVKMDIEGNIRKLGEKHSTDPERFQHLLAMMEQEIETSTTTARNSATDALLWLKRALEFICEFFTETMGDHKNISEAASKAYCKTLRPFHGFIVRGIFAVTMKAVPSYDAFIVALAPSKEDAQHPEYEVRLFEDGKIYLASLKNILVVINSFYDKHKLDNEQTV